MGCNHDFEVMLVDKEWVNRDKEILREREWIVLFKWTLNLLGVKLDHLSDDSCHLKDKVCVKCGYGVYNATAYQKKLHELLRISKEKKAFAKKVYEKYLKSC